MNFVFLATIPTCPREISGSETKACNQAFELDAINLGKTSSMKKCKGRIEKLSNEWWSDLMLFTVIFVYEKSIKFYVTYLKIFELMMWRIYWESEFIEKLVYIFEKNFKIVLKFWLKRRWIKKTFKFEVNKNSLWWIWGEF